MFLSFARVVRLSLQQFHRNLWLSIATITLLILSLLTVNLVVALGAVSQAAVTVVQDKIDVSVYFKPEVSNEEVEQVRNTLLKRSEVKEVAYIPKEGALARFKERHKDDPVISESLQELGENPFGATLAVSAHDPEQYPKIIEFLEAPEYKEIIEEKNFEDHRLVISRINTLMRNIRSFGLGVAGVFGVIAILVVINTVRVAVYTHRGEIRIMRLVGASSWFVRGPFLFEALLFSFAATILTAAVVYLGLYFVQPHFDRLFENVSLSLIGYYSANAIFIFGAQFVGIFFLTALSSFFAVRRYLRV
ncbi:FtsX-like permease family protein [Candidatus Uhrbacteria bacterium]|nr:FtsX-like permease family protein [Candidatus Uhrbacteria bacterium]